MRRSDLAENHTSATKLITDTVRTRQSNYYCTFKLLGIDYTGILKVILISMCIETVKNLLVELKTFPALLSMTSEETTRIILPLVSRINNQSPKMMRHG